MELARQIAEARRCGAALAHAPPPLTLAQGYAVADEVLALLGAQAGWKVGATNAAAMAALGIDAPIRGRVLARGVLASGTIFAPPGLRPVEIEPEIILSADGGRAWLGLEIVRPSRDDALALGAGFIVADNAAHVALVIGPELALAALDNPAALGVRLAVNGVERHAGNADAVLGDPRRALAWLRGAIDLGADEIVATGAITRAVVAGPGTRVVADFGRWGSVSITIAA